MKRDTDNPKRAARRGRSFELVSRRIFLSSVATTAAGATVIRSAPGPKKKGRLESESRPSAQFALPPPAGQEASYSWYLPQFTDPTIFTTIGLPADPAETAVSPRGELLYASDLVNQGTHMGRFIQRTRYARNSLAFALAEGARIVPIGMYNAARQSLDKGYLPIVITRWQYADLDIRQTTFSEPMKGVGYRYQSGLESTLAWAVFEITNHGVGVRPLTLLAAHMGNEENLKPNLTYSGGVVLKEGSALFSAQVPSGCAMDFHPVYPADAAASAEVDPYGFLRSYRGLFNTLAVRGEIGAGKTLRIVFNQKFDFPGAFHWGPRAQAVVKPDELTRRSADKALQAARVDWSGLHQKVSRFETPDDVLNNIVSKAMLDGYFLTKRWEGRYVVFDSVCYRCQWDDSSTKWFYALDLMGDHSTSEHLLETVFARQGQRKPAGTRTHRGCFSDVTNTQYDGSDASWASCNGWALWAMAEHARLSNDAAWIRQHKRQILEGCQWILRERQFSKEKPGNACAGLLYGKYVCDMPDMARVSGIGYFTYTDAINYMGLNQISRLLSDWGYPEGQALLKEAQDYRHDILACVDRLTDKSQSLWYVPFDLGAPRYFDRYYYDACGPLTLAVPGGLVSCDDARIQSVIRWIIDRTHRGSLEEATAGTREKATAGAMFYTLDLALTLLELGRVEDFLRIFYTLLPANISHETLTTCEWRSNTQPHVNSVAGLVRMLRTMMIQERDDGLYLLQGIPRRWLEQDKAVRIIEAPTWYGTISLRSRSKVNHGLVSVELKPPERIGSVPVRLKMRLPGGRHIRRVVVNGRKHPKAEGDWISLTGLTGKTDIVVYTT